MIFNLGEWASDDNRVGTVQLGAQPEMDPGALAFFRRVQSEAAAAGTRLGTRSDQNELYSLAGQERRGDRVRRDLPARRRSLLDTRCRSR